LRFGASRPGLAQDLLDPGELFAVCGEWLDLDLLDLANDAPAVEERDRRHGHLGQRVPALPDSEPDPPGAMAGDAHATEVVVAAPPSLWRMAMCAAAALCMPMTISSGEVRVRPFCRTSK